MKKWWDTVDSPVLTAVDDRVLRNYEKLLELDGGIFYDEATL